MYGIRCVPTMARRLGILVLGVVLASAVSGMCMAEGLVLESQTPCQYRDGAYLGVTLAGTDMPKLNGGFLSVVLHMTIDGEPDSASGLYRLAVVGVKHIPPSNSEYSSMLGTVWVRAEQDINIDITNMVDLHEDDGQWCILIGNAGTNSVIRRISVSSGKSGKDLLIKQHCYEKAWALGNQENEYAEEHKKSNDSARLLTMPNPFNGAVAIRVAGMRPGETWNASIMNVRGELVRSFRLQDECVWDGRDMNGRAIGSGLYFVRVREAGGTILSGKVMYIK